MNISASEHSSCSKRMLHFACSNSWFIRTQKGQGNARDLGNWCRIVKHRWGWASLGVRVAEPPGRRRIFEIIQIICQEISKICINLAYFSTKLNNHWVNCLPFWRKNTKCWEILRCVQKLSKDFLRKFQKVHYFSIFSKN